MPRETKLTEAQHAFQYGTCNGLRIAAAIVDSHMGPAHLAGMTPEEMLLHLLSIKKQIRDAIDCEGNYAPSFKL